VSGVVLGIGLAATATSAASAPPDRLADGVALAVAGRRLEVRVCRDDVIRVVDAPPGPFFARRSLVTVADACEPTAFEVKTAPGAVHVVTKRLAARVALPAGVVSFLDPAGRVLLAEKAGGGRTLVAAEVMGERTFHARAEFEPQKGEALYGLGAHQNGWMSHAGRDVELYQHNIVDSVPRLEPRLGAALGQHIAHEAR
jgi:alpha-D-xyloside xylohydrolase